MTRERKTSILALIMICIVCLFLAGCVTKRKVMTETATSNMETTKVEQEKDTTSTETHDTTKITQRLVPVEVAIPPAMMERTTNDTTSVLETDLFKSTATWSNGKLTHTLEVKPGAKVKGQTAVTDTTKSSSNKTTAKNTRNSSTDSKSKQDNTEKESKTTTPASRTGWLTTGIIIGVAATTAIIWKWRKRRQAKTPTT